MLLFFPSSSSNYIWLACSLSLSPTALVDLIHHIFLFYYYNNYNRKNKASSSLCFSFARSSRLCCLLLFAQSLDFFEKTKERERNNTDTHTMQTFSQAPIKTKTKQN